MNIYLDKFIKMALEEDLGILGDITTDNIFSDEDISIGNINYREEAVVGGLEFAKRVFELIDENIKFEIYKKDGEIANPNEIVAKVEGKTKAILTGERIALNIMQRVSGIATNTKRYVDKIKQYNVKLADTRKTTPLFRYFEKYGVKIGGGINHRFGLYDAVMIKDNHIAAAGTITKAVENIKSNVGHTVKIEVEVESREQLLEALNMKVDIIMLDNIRGKELKEYAELIGDKAIIEASGNINIDNIEDIAKSGVDVISTGSIIYNAKNIDIGMDFE
ncbi:carboxylating nicotinate-nucleotide diphosphorylase [Haliovirga abyssi]|uniref:Probable nicotinate-nucleotide pyrophosphorylase [carboxylating] n=1 Tax=Haliovirga abyssi TaxID=2996794 RepID=A0AAU9D145_9FUSO|nr:carboxylating nicotinate-nucleotide diphosphorylase [Haliovirga abyssi]BDU49691.1 nicotinate-nucleotide diphosphorylase (carboxylating) [Haliovirga abyssi]